MKRLQLISPSVFLVETADGKKKYGQLASHHILNLKKTASEIGGVSSSFFVDDLSSLTNSNLTLPLIFF